MKQYEYVEYDPLAGRQASDAEGQLTVYNILASYHGNYDLYSEAIQNAMDAVHTRWMDEGKDGYDPQIIVVVDLGKNSFTVIDNGVGISPSNCFSVLPRTFP